MGFDISADNLKMLYENNEFGLGIIDYGWMFVTDSGILTRWYTPHMRGRITGRGSGYIPAGAVNTVGTILVSAYDNYGSCWNDSTGRFTCPVAGTYLMTAGNICATGSGYIYLYKNGAQVHFTHWNVGGSWQYTPLSAPVVAAAGDYLSFMANVGSGTGLYGAGDHGMYSISLMA
jgi:hypothetical protein